MPPLPLSLFSGHIQFVTQTGVETGHPDSAPDFLPNSQVQPMTKHTDGNAGEIQIRNRFASTPRFRTWHPNVSVAATAKLQQVNVSIS